MKVRTFVSVTMSILFLTACGGGGPATSSGLRVVRDTVGDTIVVRTVSGSVWGAPATLAPEVSIGRMEGDPHYLFGAVNSVAVAADGTIYVVDSQAAEVKAFDPTGTWVRTLGRRGQGPGELEQPEAVAVLSDGRVVVRDPGNARLQVYGPDGSPVATWLLRSMLHTSAPLWTDRHDDVYIEFLVNIDPVTRAWHIDLIRYGPDGVVRDTLQPPDHGYRTPVVEAHFGKGSSASYGVPFTPSEHWTVHPDGYFVYGLSTDYRIDLLRTDAPVLRIERTSEPVAVKGGEKEARQQEIEYRMHGMVPGWKWNGPSIPDTKPPFGNILTGQDGRVWVVVPRPAVEKPNPEYDPKKPDSQATRWIEPIAFDVFESDGTYLGRVNAPEDFAMYPWPFVRGDTVWAVTNDSLGVQRVVRYHVQHGGAS
jgi:hypothetical protein